MIQNVSRRRNQRTIVADAELMSVPIDTILRAPPWIADTTPDPHPPNMDSVSAPARETGSMPCAQPLVLADIHAPRVFVPEVRKKIEIAVVAPAWVAKRRALLVVSWRAVAAFSLGAAVTAMAGAIIDTGMTHVVALTCALVAVLWCLVCFERR